MAQSKNYSIDMTTGPMLPKIAKFMMPLIIIGFLQLAYTMADAVVVGQFCGSDALAAVGSTGSLISLLCNAFIGLSAGTSVGVAQYFGSGDEEKVSRMVHTSMLLSLLIGLGVTVLGLFCSYPLLKWMKTPDNVIDQSNLYMFIYFLGAPAMLVYNFGASILRAVGDTKRPLYMLIVAGTANVIMNVVFVALFHWDVAGVAIATIVSAYICAAMVVLFLMRSKTSIRLDIKKLRIHKEITGFILRIGIPSGLQSTMFNISNVLIQSGTNSFGSAVVAACSSSGVLDNVIYICMGAVAQATVSFVGQNYGAKKLANMRNCTRICLILVSLIGFGLGVIVYIFGEPLMHLFTQDPEVIAVGVEKLHVVSLVTWICGAMDVLSCSTRSMGYSVSAMLVTVIGVCGVRIVWLYTAFVAMHTIPILFISYPVSWAATLIVHFFNYRRCLRLTKKKFDAEEGPVAA